MKWIRGKIYMWRVSREFYPKYTYREDLQNGGHGVNIQESTGCAPASTINGREFNKPGQHI